MIKEINSINVQGNEHILVPCEVKCNFVDKDGYWYPEFLSALMDVLNTGEMKFDDNGMATVSIKIPSNYVPMNWFALRRYTFVPTNTIPQVTQDYAPEFPVSYIDVTYTMEDYELEACMFKLYYGGIEMYEIGVQKMKGESEHEIKSISLAADYKVNINAQNIKRLDTEVKCEFTSVTMDDANVWVPSFLKPLAELLADNEASNSTVVLGKLPESIEIFSNKTYTFAPINDIPSSEGNMQCFSVLTTRKLTSDSTHVELQTNGLNSLIGFVRVNKSDGTATWIGEKEGAYTLLNNLLEDVKELKQKVSALEGK